MRADPAVSICIVTYKRPAPLGRLLQSLTLQTGNFPPHEIIIVDNDFEGSALPVWKAFATRLPVRYVIEPTPGIAPARNRSVEASSAPYIAFLDDDQDVNPDWLAKLYAAAVSSGADGVFGPVVGKIEGELPAWVRDVKFFDYPPIAPGSPIPAHETRTGNCCLRRAALPSGAPFDVSLALIGGEDVELFGRMIRGGSKLIAIGEPMIHEIRSSNRADAAWLIRRNFRNGGTVAYCEWRHFDRLSRAGLAIRELLNAGSCCLRALLELRRSRSAAFTLFLRSCSALGRVAWTVGVVYAEYSRNR